MSQTEQARIFATLTAQEGKADALREVLTGLVSATLTEPGCLHYILHEDPSAPGNFYFFEAYQNQAAFDAHLSSPHLTEAAAKLGTLLSKPPHVAVTKFLAGS
jgi:quinol monooxygenase YgiN